MVLFSRRVIDFFSHLLSLFFFILPLDYSSVRSSLAQPVVRFPLAPWTPFKLENSNRSEFDYKDRNDTRLKQRHEGSYGIEGILLLKK